MFTKQFAADLTERAVKTFAQAVLGVLIVANTVTHLKWGAILDAAGLATAISVLTSLVGSQVGAGDSGSFLPANVDPPQADHGYGLIEICFAVLLLVIALVVLFHYVG